MTVLTFSRATQQHMAITLRAAHMTPPYINTTVAIITYINQLTAQTNINIVNDVFATLIANKLEDLFTRICYLDHTLVNIYSDMYMKSCRVDNKEYQLFKHIADSYILDLQCVFTHKYLHCDRCVYRGPYEPNSQTICKTYDLFKSARIGKNLCSMLQRYLSENQHLLNNKLYYPMYRNVNNESDDSIDVIDSDTEDYVLCAQVTSFIYLQLIEHQELLQKLRHHQQLQMYTNLIRDIGKLRCFMSPNDLAFYDRYLVTKK